MGLLSWLRGGEFRSTFANPSNAMLESFGVTASYTGERVTTENAMELAAVRSAVAMISEAVGGLPLKVYRIVDDDERVEARGHRSWRLLHDKPNEHCTARRFWSATAAQLLIYENSFIYKERDPFTEEVESLYHLDPTQVKVEMNGPANKRYVVEGPPKRVYTAEEVLHIVGFSLDGYYGASRITQAKQTLGAAIARAKFEGGFYKRGGRFPGVLEHPGRLKDAKKLGEQFAAIHGGVEQMHKAPVLEEGMKFNRAGMNMEEMQFAQLAEQTRTEIAVLFNIPAAYLGASTGDSLTYTNEASNDRQFHRLAVLPIAETIAKALSSDPSLLPWNVMYAEFVYEAVMRADPTTQIEYLEKLQKMLNLDPEYIAARLNIPKDAIKEPEPVTAVTGVTEQNGTAPDPTQNPAMVAQAAKVAAVS